jgi:hypothetical protein
MSAHLIAKVPPSPGLAVRFGWRCKHSRVLDSFVRTM